MLLLILQNLIYMLIQAWIETRFLKFGLCLGLEAKRLGLGL